MLEDAEALPECNVMTPDHIPTLMTTDHTAIQVRSSGQDRAGLDWSSWKGLNTGHHEKAPNRCPCSQSATLQGNPQTVLLHEVNPNP